MPPKLLVVPLAVLVPESNGWTVNGTKRVASTFISSSAPFCTHMLTHKHRCIQV